MPRLLMACYSLLHVKCVLRYGDVEAVFCIYLRSQLLPSQLLDVLDSVLFS